LHIIKALIRTDKEKAIKGIEDFSDYLQANLDVINSDTLIPFEDELTHIEAYTSLALSDNSKNITIKYDLKETLFRVPPLSIEPLVENALVHGVNKDGTIILSTYSENDNIVITVIDDGKGFDEAATKKEKKRVGIGVANVRTRLETLCNGTMNIDSSSAGTTITIKIPVNQ
jgi:sensor histidine kinase YesM